MDKNELQELLIERKDSVDEMIEEITPSVYGNLQSAIELSKWPDGSRLTPQQLEYCMQAVILYETRNLPEQERTGYNLPTGCSKDKSATVEEPLNIKDEQLTIKQKGQA